MLGPASAKILAGPANFLTDPTSVSRTATRLLLLAVACAVGVTLLLWVQRLRTPDGPAEATILAATRAEPVTFNPLVASDLASLTVTRLIHTTLVQIDHQTQEVVPALAT